MKPYLFEAIEHGKKYPLKAFVASIEHSSFHWHYEYELILVLKGKLSVNVIPKPVILESGDIILINSKEIHELNRVNEDNLCLFIQLSQILFSDYKDINKTYHFHLNSKSEDLHPKKDYRFFANLAAKIGLECQDEGMVGFYRVKSLLYMLIADLFEYVPYEIHQKAFASKGNENVELLMKIIEFIQENFKNDHVLDELYKTLGISEKTTYRFLKYNIGLSTKELVTAYKVEASKSLLKYSDKSINYIVNECGFGSENSFYRVFKQKMGITPNEYRHNDIKLEKDPAIKGYLNYNQMEATELLIRYSERGT